MAKFGIGQPMRRMEDGRLLTGAGRHVGDIDLPRRLPGAFLRSPHAHANIRADGRAREARRHSCRHARPADRGVAGAAECKKGQIP